MIVCNFDNIDAFLGTKDLFLRWRLYHPLSECRPPFLNACLNEHVTLYPLFLSILTCLVHTLHTFG